MLCRVLVMVCCSFLRQVVQDVNNGIHLARKYARILVRRRYLFREANSFPRAQLEESCELRGTDNVRRQISEYIFAPNGGYCVYYPSNLFRNFLIFFKPLFNVDLQIANNYANIFEDVKNKINRLENPGGGDARRKSQLNLI